MIKRLSLPVIITVHLLGSMIYWNRSTISVYKVVFVPFENGKPTGEPEDFLTGFIKDIENAEVYGRLVGITVLEDGCMLVVDDASNVIWKVPAKK